MPAFIHLETDSECEEFESGMWKLRYAEELARNMRDYPERGHTDGRGLDWNVHEGAHWGRTIVGAKRIKPSDGGEGGLYLYKTQSEITGIGHSGARAAAQDRHDRELARHGISVDLPDVAAVESASTNELKRAQLRLGIKPVGVDKLPNTRAVVLNTATRKTRVELPARWENTLIDLELRVNGIANGRANNNANR